MTVYNPGVAAGGGTTAATDTIYDAKGDLVVGTGPDAAARKAIGSDGQVLTADTASAGGVKWAIAATQLDRKRALWKPTAVIDSTLDGTMRAQNLVAQAAILTSGVLRVSGGVVIPAGQVVTSIAAWSAAGATTPLNQWFCLIRQSDRTVLAKTTDDTTTAWAANTIKTLNLSAPYTPSAEEAVYIGVLVVATTTPTLYGWSTGGTSALAALVPIAHGNGQTLTDPASLGGTATAFNAHQLGFYAHIV